MGVTADAEDKTRRKTRLRLIREGPQGGVKKDPTSGDSLSNGGVPVVPGREGKQTVRAQAWGRSA